MQCTPCIAHLYCRTSSPHFSKMKRWLAQVGVGISTTLLRGRAHGRQGREGSQLAKVGAIMGCFLLTTRPPPEGAKRWPAIHPTAVVQPHTCSLPQNCKRK